jgi:hypothetical protein
VDTSILFQFPDRRSAYYAFDTLDELGYEPVIQSESNPPEVHVHLTKCDVTSALEIAQACGGEMMEQQPMQEHQVMDTAYNILDEIDIPAHIVNEDFTDAYMQGDAFSADVRI